MADCCFGMVRRASLIILVGAVAAGCAGGRSGGPAGATRSDRLMAYYPDLHRRFAVIADFEDPVHFQLVEVEPKSDRTRADVDQRHGRPETGGSCLSFTAADSQDTLVLSSARADDWHFRRNWMDYDLLLLSVGSPERGMEIELGVSSGTGGSRRSTRWRQALERGWNLIRLDLEELSEQLALDDVRTLTLSVPEARRPVTIRVDDVILAGNQEDLFGDSTNITGALYVRRVGRRWRVGSGGRFELTFAHGQIVAWHNLAADPYRLRNLVDGTVLGPTVVERSGMDRSDPSVRPKVRRAVSTRQWITEMNRVRVVIEVSQNPVAPWSPGASTLAQQHVRFVIYKTGQVYVHLQATGEPGTSLPDEVGVSLAVHESNPGEWKDLSKEIAKSLDSGENTGLPALPLLIANGPASTTLLAVVAPRDGGSMEESAWKAAKEEGQRILRWTASRPVVEPVSPRSSDDTDGGHSWDVHFYLGGTERLESKEALDRAVNFTHPSRPLIAVGEGLGTDGAATLDPASGSYRVVLTEGRLHLILDGRRAPIHNPVFEVETGVSGSHWVYLDQKVFQEWDRLPNDRMIFQLPAVITGLKHVEVLSDE